MVHCRHRVLTREVIPFGWALAKYSRKVQDLHGFGKGLFRSWSSGKCQGVGGEAFRRLENNVDSIIIHFDVDVIDGEDFPAADVPHYHGLSFDETLDALQVLFSQQ